MRIITFIKNYIIPRRPDLVPAVFLHIQKTAGTSIVDLAFRRYRGDLISHGQYLERKFPELEKISFVSGHFGYEFARPLLPSRYSFTFLRDPVKRVLSFYYFCRTCNPREYPIYQLAQQLNLEQFLRAGLEDDRVRCYIWNQLTWQLAIGYGDPSGRRIDDFTEEQLIAEAIEHMGQLSHIGFTETFEDDLGIIFTALKFQDWQKGYVLNSTWDKLAISTLSSVETGLVNELTRLDQELYRTAWGAYRPGQPLPFDVA